MKKSSNASAATWFETRGLAALLTMRVRDLILRGDVPLAGLASAMKEVGYTELPMLEVISHNPDADIAGSCRRLQQAGFSDAR